MEDNNLVSIIIPVYNSSKYLEETIKSIEKQTYKNYEAIFIDDKSSDNSKEIIEKYKMQNNKIKLIALKKHKGVSRARNIGIRIAKGRFLTFLDSDDIWLENKVQSQIDFIRKNNYEFVYCSFRYMNDEGTKISKQIKIKEKTSYKQALSSTRILTITTMIDLYKIPKRYCCMPNQMNEDIITWWKILKKGYIAYGQNEVLAYYRQTKKSRSSDKKKTAFYRWQIYRKVEKLSLIQSMYCFINYAINAVIKRVSSMKPIPKYKEIQVGISTRNLNSDSEVTKLLNKININSKYLIVNQNYKKDADIKNKNVITKNEIGLSKSRNTVIENANTEIVLLADDDVIYNENYTKIILDSYNKYKNYDIICFYVKSKNKNRKIKKIRTGKIGWLNSMKIASVEISFKRSSIINNNLKFNEQFGAGTKLNRGEEQIFLYNALRKKLKIRFVNKQIAEVEQSKSSWIEKFDKEFFIIQGKVFKEMSPKYYKLLCIQYAIRKYKMYYKDISLSESLKNMLNS